MYTEKSWYKRILSEQKNKMLSSLLFFTLFALCATTWNYLTDTHYEWQKISPIEEPMLTIRLLSALVFVSLGRVLYELKIYYVLCMLFVGILHDRQSFNDLKKIIWYSLMALMGFVIAPWIIDVLNAVISFCYNLYVLLLYLLPASVLSLTIFMGGWYVFKKHGKL